MAMSFPRPLLCQLAILTLTNTLTQPIHAQNWTTRNPRLSGPQLNAVASSSARAVAVGQYGHVVTSADGTNWSAQNVGTNRHLTDVIYASGRFVAVGALYDASGEHSLALTSSDGLTWTERPTNSRWWKSVTYGNGLFVAVGDYTIDTSPDGITWTRRDPYYYDRLQGVAYGNGLFVTMGVWNDGRGTVYYGVQWSRDGINWSGADAPANALLRGIAFGGGQFVMVGDGGRIFTSVDGMTWTQRNAMTSATLHDVGFLDGWFVAAGAGGTVLRSQDANQWFHPQDSEPCELYGVGGGAGRAIAVGGHSSVLTSSDRQLWTSPVAVTYSDLHAITFAQQKFVAVGAEGSGVVSSDGRQWTARPVYNPLGGMPNTWFNAVTFANGSFLTVGGEGFPVFRSPDAASWTGQHSNLGIDDFFGLGYANGRFVTVGILSTGSGARGGIRSSENGTNWTTRLTGLQFPVRCVVHGNGLWVAAGSNLVTSADGITWTARTSPVSGTFHAAAFGLGRFVLAGDVGGVITSSNGTSWTFHSAFGGGQVRGLTFGGTDFVAVGQRDGRGVIWNSPDGVSWTESGGAAFPLKAVSYNNGSFTAVGEHGLILQSAATSGRLTIQRLSTGVIEISCRTEVGRQYRLQASLDGRSWTDVRTFVATSTETRYRETAPTGRMRCYRLVSP